MMQYAALNSAMDLVQLGLLVIAGLAVAVWLLARHRR